MRGLRRSVHAQEFVAARGSCGATVVFDPGKVTPKQIIEAIVKAGYRASLPATKGS
ncbi:MAG: hypothetical protein ACYCWW_12730 [Deltaproteobacteria bacterium]